jgi:hypothetical protein
VGEQPAPLARVLGRRQWDLVAEACDGPAQASQDKSLRAIVHEARDALDPWYPGSYVMRQRFGNLSRKGR